LGENVFRISLLLLWGCLLAMRAYYAARQHQAGVRVTRGRQAIRREGVGHVAAQAAVFVLLVVALAVYAARPEWMRSFVLPFPHWIRWAGTGRWASGQGGSTRWSLLDRING
jgi:hypothetical protein